MRCRYDVISHALARLTLNVQSLPNDLPGQRSDRIVEATVGAMSEVYDAGVADEREWVLAVLENMHVMTWPGASAEDACTALRRLLAHCVRTHSIGAAIVQPVDRAEDNPKN